MSDISLKDFNVSASDATPVKLLGADDAYAEFGLIANGTTAPTATTVWKNKDGVFTWRNSDGVEFTRTITADNYVVIINDTIKNATLRHMAV